MNIHVKINQRACILKGLNAPNSGADIEVNPTLLPADVKRILASKIERGNEADLTFDHPNPTLKHLSDRLIELLRAEKDAIANELIFEEYLSPEDLRLYRDGRLSQETRLLTNLRLILAGLHPVTSIKLPCGYTLWDAVLFSQTAPQAGTEPVVIAIDLATGRWQLDQEFYKQNLVDRWTDIRNGQWLDFIERVEGHSMKVIAVHQQIGGSRHIRIGLKPTTTGFQPDVELWLRGEAQLPKRSGVVELPTI